MRGGMLQHIIMHKLSEHPHSGYSLVKEIAETTGHKPSFGSIYPILENLAKQELVTVRQDGRKKMYTLTQKGKRDAKERREQFATHATVVLEEMKMFCELTGQDSEPITAFFEEFKRGGNPLGPAAPHAIKLRDTLFRIGLDGRAKRHSKELIKIIDDTVERLERLK